LKNGAGAHIYIYYLDIIQDLVHGYNHSVHSFLNDTPANSTKSSKNYLEAIGKRFREIRPLEKLNEGDNVRLMIKRKTFDKASSTPRWTSTVHTIEEIDTDHKYHVSGRVGLYSRNELLKVGEVNTNPHINNDQQDTEENLRKHRASRSLQRRLNREGI
jgi:hypothetical protein